MAFSLKALFAKLKCPKTTTVTVAKVGSMQIAVINKSTLVSNADAETMTAAAALQMTNHLAPAWDRYAASVTFYADPNAVPKGAFVMALMDSTTEEGALGYHSEAGDEPDGYVFAQPVLTNGGGVLSSANGPSVSSVLSHEVCEMFCDEYVNCWVDGPALPQGTSYALEVCDPVESDSYMIDVNGTQVQVSNFVLPAWFDDQAAGKPVDYMGKSKGPFTMSSGGYMVVRNAPGSEQQVFGEYYPAWVKAAKLANKASRMNKRTT